LLTEAAWNIRVAASCISDTHTPDPERPLIHQL